MILQVHSCILCPGSVISVHNYALSYTDAAEPVSIWKDREFIAAIAIAGVAFVILLLLLLAICLLIFYHRKVSKLSKYGLGKNMHTQ